MDEQPQADEMQPASAAEVASLYDPAKTFVVNIGQYRYLPVRLRPQPITDKLLLGHAANAILRRIHFERQPWEDKRDEQTRYKEEYEADIRLCAYGFVDPKFIAVGEPDIAQNETGPQHYHYNEIALAAMYIRGQLVPQPASFRPAAGDAVDPGAGVSGSDGEALRDDTEPVTVAEPVT